MTKPPDKDKKVHVSESGRAAAVRTGTSEREVHEALTGADQLPGMGQELGRPPGRPDFDPHDRSDVDVDVEEAVNARVVILAFVGQEGGSLEERAKEVMAYAEGKGMYLLTASIGPVDDDVWWAVVGG